MEKTLVGTSGWLFLKNDSCKELEVHCNNLCLASETFQRDRYAKYMKKFFLTIFPNKSFLYSSYLPAGYNAKYRPAFDIYKKVLGDQLLDGYKYLKGLSETYYKTDTHINFRGAYLIHCAWITDINRIFSLSIPIPEHTIIRKEVSSLSELNIGIGDLTWGSNRGSISLAGTDDVFFKSDTVDSLYMTYKIAVDGSIRLLGSKLEDITEKYAGATLDWSVVSECILYKKNSNGVAKKVLIFYDSLLCSTLSLYINLFTEIYMVKNIFNPALVDKINPDLVFEFRVERFLL
jgi:hypothetical protein